MKIAHLSDPHVLDLDGVPRARLWFNKRLTGLAMLRLHRGSKHKRWVVEAMMDDLRASGADHVVVTGDLTNLALEPEFEAARALLARSGFAADALTVVPGNHDVYTRGAERSQRFARYFAPHMTCDLALADAANHPSGPFPFVRLRGDAALIGLSTAVARLPLFASGRAGARQLGALAAALDHPEVRARTPVLLMHHPLVNPRSASARWLRGFAEAPRVRALLDARAESIVLHGHLHDRALRELRSSRGHVVHHVGATSASMLHPAAERVAGYNVYDVGPAGLRGVSARVWDADARRFVDGPVRRIATPH